MIPRTPQTRLRRFTMSCLGVKAIPGNLWSPLRDLSGDRPVRLKQTTAFAPMISAVSHAEIATDSFVCQSSLEAGSR